MLSPNDTQLCFDLDSELPRLEIEFSKPCPTKPSFNGSLSKHTSKVSLGTPSRLKTKLSPILPSYFATGLPSKKRGLIA